MPLPFNIIRHNSYSCQDRRTVNNRTYYFLFLFSRTNPLEPAGILDFPARYVNIYYRQTILLNLAIIYNAEFIAIIKSFAYSLYSSLSFPFSKVIPDFPLIHLSFLSLISSSTKIIIL